MDENISSLPSAQAAPAGGPIAKTNLWQVDLALRPKDDSQFTGDQIDTTSCDSTSDVLLPSTPSLLSQDDDSEIPDWDESLDTPPPFVRPARDLELLVSCGGIREGPAENYGFMFPQFDGACENRRGLPFPPNPCLTDMVPSYSELVAQRRLYRIQLNTSVLDLAYLDVPLPEGIVLPVSNSSPRASLMRRSSDGFFSAASMFNAAFPNATGKELYAERKQIKSLPTTKPGDGVDDYWVHPAVALNLADEYCILPYVRALLDPAEIQTPVTFADDDSEPIKAPPTYPAITAATPPASPVVKVEPAVPHPGHAFPIASDGQPILRLFDTQTSSKYKGIPDDLLVVYNPMNRLRYMQSINTATSVLEPDLRSLIFTIEGVVYEREGGEKQAGAIVFLHGTSHCSQFLYVNCSCPQTKQQALLVALLQAVTMVKHLTTADCSLQEVRIMTSSTQLCQLMAVETDRMETKDAVAVEAWVEQADKALWKEIDEHWTDITEGRAGPLVDVRLWCVSDEHAQPAKEMAIAEMYRADGRDWYAENGKGQEDPLKTVRSTDAASSGNGDDNNSNNAFNFPMTVDNRALPYLGQTTFVPPESVVARGYDAVARWSAETEAKHKQILLHLEMTGKEIENITNPAQTDASLVRPSEKYWDDVARAMVLARSHREAMTHLSEFMAEHPSFAHAGFSAGTQDDSSMDVDAVGLDLVQTVAKMVMADEEPDQAAEQMKCE